MDNSSKSFNCLAVDMGAGSIRVMIGIIDNQSIKYKEIHRTKNSIQEIDGHDRWDIQSIFKEIVSGINKAIDSTDVQLSSIGVDSWGVDFALMDKNGDLLDMPIAYRDSRTEGMMEAWKEELSGYETYKQTGINFYIFNTLFQILSMRDSELLSNTRTILFIPSYISYLLSGYLGNEQTIASTSQILNIDGKRWDPDITGLLRLDKNILSDIIQPGTILGPVINNEVKDKSIDTIAICGHDTACAIASIPAEDSNFAYISTGTWCNLGVESQDPLLSEEAFSRGFTNERGYGNTYRTLKNTVGLWLIQGLKKEYPEDTCYSELEEFVNQTKQTDQFIDPDDEIFFNPPNMKDAFDTFFEKTGQKKPGDTAEYIRIAYDSLCFSFRYLLEFLEESRNEKLDRIHVIGGGCQSDYFNQHISTICNKEVKAGPIEGAVYGNILVQAIAKGHIKTLDEGRELVKNSIEIKHYTPEENTGIFDDVYMNYLNYKNKEK